MSNIPGTLTELQAWLVAKGNDAIDLAETPIKNAVKKFSDNAVALEKIYLKWYKTRANIISKNQPFVYETDFNNLSAQIKSERYYRRLLLRALYAAGANPADYGLQIYGLAKTEIDAAYPGLRYDVSQVRLDAVPVILIGAGVLAAIVAATSSMIAAIAFYNKVDLVRVQKEAYQKAGYSETDAFKQAANDAAEMDKNSGSITASLGKLADLAPWIVGGLILFKVLG